jgi:hypothetical protein
MIEHILIVEPDRTFADQLVAALKKIGPFTITATADTLEASLLLTRQSRDLAFIPILKGSNVADALRAIQPDLRLVLMAPAANVTMPDDYAGKVQAVLLKSHLETDLATVLDEAASHPLVTEEGGLSPTAELPEMDTAVIIAALQKTDLGRLVQTVVFAHKTDLLAHWGDLNITQAATVALVVGDKWQGGDNTTLVQFIHLAAKAGDLLLYTREVPNPNELVGGYLLTLVALPETPLHELRQQSNKLVADLADVLQGKTLTEASAETAVAHANGNQQTYAIVWRPIRPIPKSLHIPLRRAIERLATANGCILTYTSVQEKLVHLVVTAPPERDSAWAAYLFKNGSEDTIQREYGVAASLWDTGYYAIESSQPLSNSELKIFLEQKLT